MVYEKVYGRIEVVGYLLSVRVTRMEDVVSQVLGSSV
jgi:hypothetical protein